MFEATFYNLRSTLKSNYWIAFNFDTLYNILLHSVQNLVCNYICNIFSQNSRLFIMVTFTELRSDVIKPKAGRSSIDTTAG